jgi:AraC-like DNA-binding protein
MKSFHKYLPVTALEEKWGFYVTTVGCNNIPAHQSYPRNKEHPSSHSFTWNKGRILDGYYIVFIPKGQGVFESARTSSVTITAGTCFLLFPGVWHRYKPDEEMGWEEYWVGFKGNYPDALMTKGFFEPGKPVVQTGLHEGLLILFQKLLETVQIGQAGYHQVIAGITLQLLGLLHTTLAYTKHDDPTGQLIDKARFLMRESLESNMDMEKLAKQLPMGYSTFRKLFKEQTGLPPNQYHLNLRLDKAKELLETTALTINEIAYQAGFDSVFYFSKIFKKKNKCSPTAYRIKKGIRV